MMSVRTDLKFLLISKAYLIISKVHVVSTILHTHSKTHVECLMDPSMPLPGTDSEISNGVAENPYPYDATVVRELLKGRRKRD